MFVHCEFHPIVILSSNAHFMIHTWSEIHPRSGTYIQCGMYTRMDTHGVGYTHRKSKIYMEWNTHRVGYRDWDTYTEWDTHTEWSTHRVDYIRSGVYIE